MSATKTRYVVGFLFNDDANHVTLIRKNRPAWQAGYLNGIGGKIELTDGNQDVAHFGAMDREAKEELGIETSWTHFVSLNYPEAWVAFFASIDQRAFKTALAKTDELIEFHSVSSLPYINVIPNLKWLIPMGIHAVLREQMVPMDIPILFGGAEISTPKTAA